MHTAQFLLLETSVWSCHLRNKEHHFLLSHLVPNVSFPLLRPLKIYLPSSFNDAKLFWTSAAAARAAADARSAEAMAARAFSSTSEDWNLVSLWASPTGTSLFLWDCSISLIFNAELLLERLGASSCLYSCLSCTDLLEGSVVRDGELLEPFLLGVWESVTPALSCFAPP